MAQEIKVTGIVKWVMPHKMDKYGKYGLSFFPQDAGTRRKITDLKTSNKMYEDDDGNFSFRFSKNPEDKYNPGTYRVLVNGKSYDGLVGNGSEAEVYLNYYSWDNSFGKGSAVSINYINVIKLIEYKPEPQEDTTGKDLPV